jgi:hypothetical protein
MQIDAITLTLRPRSMWEGCDLGVRLLHFRMRSVYACYLAVAAPTFLICLATYPLEPWLPAVGVWLAKPWLDHAILFALSRALFGEPTGPSELWVARDRLLMPNLVSLLLLRLSASRSFKLPIMQLEGLAGRAQRDRVRQLTLRHRGVARAMTLAFANAELALCASVLLLPVLLAPHIFELEGGWLAGFATGQAGLISSIAYAVAVGFLEPFYVAAGFGLYLNRRVELEAWDIEQEFRRAFAR